MGWLTSSREVKDAESLFRLFGGSTPDPEWPASTFLNHVSQGWDKNELVYACIEEKATSMPEATLRVYDALGRRGEPLQDHPLRRLLANPNPLMSEFELFELLSVHLDLAGNAFWEKVRDRSGRVVELWPVRPDRIRMRRGNHAVSYGYAVDSSRSVPIDVVHFKLPNPIDPMVGTPPMRAALRATALDNEATDFVKALLQNHAIPGVVVKMAQLDSVLDDATTTRLKEKWKASYSGKRRGEPAFLQAGMDVQELGLNLKDLEFPDLRTISESRICMAFGVPPIIVGAKVGLDRSTFANFAEARKAFWEQTLMPLQRRVRDTIAGSLLPDMPGGTGTRGLVNVSLRWDTSEVLALKESEESRWTRATEAFRAGGLTVNDYRAEIGLSDVTGGDVFLMPSGTIATRDMSGAVQQLNGQTPPQEPAPPKADALGIETKAADPLRAKAVKAHEDTLADYFAARRIDARAAIHGKAALPNRARLDDDLTGRLQKAGLSAATAAGMSVSTAYDADRTEAYQFKRAQGIAKDVNDSLESAVGDALVSEDPSAAVDDLFATYQESKVPQMATTMATAALAWGKTEAGRQASGSGADVTKTWITGAKSRPTHAAMNGETVGINEPFSNGMNWPGDPSGGADEVAGCNCDVQINIE
jgi:HK97 family phage portal protein